MGSELVTCPAGIGATTLADFRAGQLPRVEMDRLRAHIAGCAVCQAELTAYDAVARLLRQQREIEPGERVLAGVRLRAARHAPRRSARVRARATWSGLGALAAVAALLLLAVHLFAADRPPGHGITARATATPTATPTPVPTIGSGQFTSVVALRDAWGSQGRVAQLGDTRLDATHRFDVMSATPDGREWLGERATLGANGEVLEMQAGLLDVATRQFTPVGPATPMPNATFGGWSACVGGDDRYVVCEIQTPSTMNPGVNVRGPASLWSYDRVSRQAREVTDLTHYAFPEFATTNGLAQVEHGMVFFTTYGQDQQPNRIYQVNLASDTITAVPLPAQSPSVVALSWPYLLYSDAPDPTKPGTTHLHDLWTGQDVTLPQVDALYAAASASGADANHMPSLTLAGDTLFVSLATGRIATSNVPPNNVTGSDAATTLYELDHAFAAGALLRPVARYHGVTGPPMGANARLVVFLEIAWDRATDRWVDYSIQPGGEGYFAVLNGSMLVLRGASTGQTTNPVLLYDTTRLG